MQIRHIFMLAVSIILVAAVGVALIPAFTSEALNAPAATELANIRDLLLAGSRPNHDLATPDFAVDGGRLYQGRQARWTLVATPPDVIVSTVAVDPGRDGDDELQSIYIGAANTMSLYRSTNGGMDWQHIPLSNSAVGGVTAMAIDASQRLVYVGTDTAGLFRLRDVGSSMILSGQLLLEHPVRQVVADHGGSGMVLARTDWDLFRAENYGLTWLTVDNLGSAPTALAIVPADESHEQPLLMVGTLDRGLTISQDMGRTWHLANEGLGFVPGSRLSIDALARDPLLPNVLYLSTSYLFGSTNVHSTPRAIAMTTDRAQTWSTLVGTLDASVVDLIPIPGQMGQVYALTSNSRAPIAIGNTPPLVSVDTAGNGLAQVPVQSATGRMPAFATQQLAWVIAGLAALALAYAMLVDLRARRRGAEHGQQTESSSTIRNHTV